VGNRRAVALVGPTGAGKSSLAMEVALSNDDVEIVSVDSMAVYREMDLATAKPSRHARARVPHHMIDILDPDQECTVSLFQDHALVALDEIAARGHVALLVGGTGLYHRAVLDDLEIPGQFPEARTRLEQRAQSPDAIAELYQQLAASDPLAASRIEPTNVRRIMRALEVIEGSGRPFSSYGPGLEAYPEIGIEQIGIDRDSGLLDAAVEARVDAWLDEGFVDEVRRLAARPAGLSRTAAQAIGYREFLAWLETDDDVQIPRDATVAATRSLIRRQRSWFRRDPRVAWTSQLDEARAMLEAALARSRASSKVGD